MASITSLPREILLHIFQFYLKNNDQMNLLKVLSKVCREWKLICTDSTLWTKYHGTLSFEEMMKISQKGYLGKTEELIVSSTETLTTKQALRLFSRLKNLKVVNFHKVKKIENNVYSAVAENCPYLREIHFSLHNNQDKASKTETIYRKINYQKMVDFFILSGSNLETINLSGCHISNFQLIIRCISDCCPNLQQLHLVDIQASSAVFSTNYVQERCSKLKVLHLDNNVRISSIKYEHGFENLQVFTFHDHSGYFLTDKQFHSVVFNSVHLKFLNLTNCAISAETICSLPACSVEYLYIAKSRICNSNNLSSVLQKWSHSLKEVDISNTALDSINEAVIRLITTPIESPLEYLNLNATKVTVDVIKQVISKCKQLEELHLESCRSLDRGMKQVYYGKSDLEILSKRIKLSLQTKFSDDDVDGTQ